MTDRTMRQLIQVIDRAYLTEGDVVGFPGNPRPRDPIAVARGGASVHRLPSRKTLDAFTQAYITAALWSSRDDDDRSLVDQYGVSDIHTETLEKIVRDCQRFRTQCAELLEQAEDQHGLTEQQAGHEFWLTRNRHGVGFWDRKMGRLGDALTQAAHSFGECDLYVSGGVIYSD